MSCEPDSRGFKFWRFGHAKLLVNLVIRSASLASSVLLLWGVTQAVSPRDQGVYYLIQSIAATSFFFDLGIGYVLANLAGNAKASGTQGLDDLSEERWAQLRALFAFALKWLTCAVLLFSLVVGALGILQIRGVDAPASWELVLWGALVLGTGGNLFLNALLNFFEGLGYAQSAGYIRFVQAITNGGLFVALVEATHSPYVIGASMAASVLSALVVVAFLYRGALVALARRGARAPLRWRSEIFPFQWRIALSWMSGYFLFQAPTLFIGRAGQLVEAGRFGLTMQIFLAVISIAQVFLTFGVSRWAALCSSGNHDQLFREYRRGAVITCAMVVASGLTLLAVALYGPAAITLRIAQHNILVFLLVGTVGFQIFITTNFYFRAQLKEALWSFSVVAAIVMISFGALAQNSSKMQSVAVGYMVTGLLLGLASLIRAYRHAQSADTPIETLSPDVVG